MRSLKDQSFKFDGILRLGLIKRGRNFDLLFKNHEQFLLNHFHISFSKFTEMLAVFLILKLFGSHKLQLLHFFPFSLFKILWV
jgi:hypothetical protein